MKPEQKVTKLKSVTPKEKVEEFIEWVGELAFFYWNTLRGFKHFTRRIDSFVQQCEIIGISSLGILSIAAIFIGSVMGYQLYVSFELFGAQGLVGGTVGVAMFREFAPVFCAIMVTGRSGAAIGAEIASMRITEQIDALDVMGVDPHEYLVVPRVAAGMLMTPLLAFFFGAIASVAASWIACGVKDLPVPVFWTQFALWTDWIDMLHCFLKSLSFGFALTFFGAFYGYRARGGASAVGLSARTTVVVSCLAILLLDYFWTMFLPNRGFQFGVHS
jgi:phospholipid/cholesterol/gamma-HCH transport system permease protein